MKGVDFRAVVIEASAGTGKTSRIADEFLKKIDRDEPDEAMRKILAVTFSEKAAIEMKMRILERIYAEIYPDLSERKKVEAENAMLKLRISTIHSFCRLLLKRFAFYAGIDPFFTVIDERQSGIIYYRAFGSFLNSPAAREILHVLKSLKLNRLREFLLDMRKLHPYATMGSPEGTLSEKISAISKHIDSIQAEIKKDLSMMDFNDLELITYRLLEEHPESLTILEDFDEKNSYIFVDEFQDTNILQWRIIHKLAEEWLSGYGAKAERGESYRMLVVGDRKRSIYKFRGAEGRIFDEAKRVLGEFYDEEKLLKNYRSAPEIIGFVNEVFKDTSPWTEQMLSPGVRRKMPAGIEINLLDASGNPDAKDDEYNWVLGRICQLVGQKTMVWDRAREEFRQIDFKDIAILMRKRAGRNFLLLEKKLKESGIPFVIVGGMGFYGEPEIVFLLSLVFALADPTDEVAVWNLRSSVHRVTSEMVYRWKNLLAKEELTMVIEEILKELNFRDGLSTQQKANTEKFLMLLQEWEGTPLYSISRDLRTMSLDYVESKADIFSEHQNAVRVMTVHGAKGLEFPAVFLLNAEDGNVILRDRIFYRKTDDGESPYAFVLNVEAEKEARENFRGLLKEEEERVLYVALTRACQYLFVSGVRGKRGWDASLWIGRLRRFEDRFPASPVRERKEPPAQEKKEGIEKFESGEAAGYAAGLTSYTEERERDFYHYERTVAGEIAHKILCDISEGRTGIDRQSYKKRVSFYLAKSGIHNTLQVEEILIAVHDAVEKNSKIQKIAKKREPGRAYSELPFIVEMEAEKIYTGFIDRVILDDDNTCCSIYDYKLEGNKPELYRRQMDIYEKAVRNIFPGNPAVRRFIIFLLNGTIKEI